MPETVHQESAIGQYGRIASAVTTSFVITPILRIGSKSVRAEQKSAKGPS
jgi:hypothetical protein